MSNLQYIKVKDEFGEYLLISNMGDMSHPILMLDSMEIKKLNFEWEKKIKR